MMITLHGNPCTTLDDYYNPMTDNYVIPFEEMTEDIMAEALALVYSKPYDVTADYGTYLLMRWDDDEQSYWCVTSWIE